MAAINGTYDIPYVKRNPVTNVLEEGSPGVDCGWWFFPAIPVTLRSKHYRAAVRPYGCPYGAEFFRDDDADILMNFYTLGGEFVRVTGAPYPTISFQTQLPFGSSPMGNINAVLTPYECVSLDPPLNGNRPIVTEGSLASNWTFLFDHFLNSLLSDELPFPLTSTGEVGFYPRVVPTVVYDGQLGQLAGYGGASIRCDIGWKSIVNTVDAYDEEATHAFECGGGLTYQRYVSTSWSSFSRRYAVLFNG
jgi:hypothetical protein